MHLSKNFTLREMCQSTTASRRGLANVPDDLETEALQILCREVLQPMRDHFGRPVRVNSGYRSAALNKAIGGSTTSQHTFGEAADIEIPGVDNLELAHWIFDNLEIDQVISECYDEGDPSSGWVHVSRRRMGRDRQEALTFRKPRPGGYTSGLPER